MSWIAVGAVTTAVSVGASAVEAHKAGKAAANQAGAQADLSREEQEDVTRAIAARKKQKESEKKLVALEFADKSKSIGADFADTQKDLKEKLEGTGLKTTAGSSDFDSKLWRQFTQTETGLYGDFGKKMAKVEGDFEAEVAGLQGVRKRAALQEKAFEEQSESWYLGKNLTT